MKMEGRKIIKKQKKERIGKILSRTMTQVKDMKADMHFLLLIFLLLRITATQRNIGSVLEIPVLWVCAHIRVYNVFL